MYTANLKSNIMATTTINTDDLKTADAFWTLLKPLKKEIRQLLAARLDNSLKEQDMSTDGDRLSEARRFVEALSVHGEKQVPSDEKGIYALLDEKY